MRDEVLETAGRKGRLLKWQRTRLQGVLAPGLNGKTELKKMNWEGPGVVM